MEKIKCRKNTEIVFYLPREFGNYVVFGTYINVKKDGEDCHEIQLWIGDYGEYSAMYKKFFKSKIVPKKAKVLQESIKIIKDIIHTKEICEVIKSYENELEAISKLYV